MLKVLMIFLFTLGPGRCYEFYNQSTGDIPVANRVSQTMGKTPKAEFEPHERINVITPSYAFCKECPGKCIDTAKLNESSYSKAKQLKFSFPRWMSELPDKLEVSGMSIPGTHDSGSADIKLKEFQTQSLSIKNQLDGGIRAFDIRCHHINNIFTIHHDVIYANLNFNDVLVATTGFLIENPRETILMRIMEENENADTQTNTRTFEKTLQEYINNYSKFFYKETFVPTLGVARGKIIILDNTPKAPGFGPLWSKFKIQDDYKLPEYLSREDQIKSKWKKAEQFFQETNTAYVKTVYVNFLSAVGVTTPPSVVASGNDDTLLGVINKNVDGMNERAKKYLSPDKLENKSRAGWVFIDFPGSSLIYSILIRN